jgi:hypothetical protein
LTTFADAQPRVAVAEITGGVTGLPKPWEQPIDSRERTRIRWAGLFDRVRTRNVFDDRRTHFLIALEERAQGFEVAVLEWISAQELRLDKEITAARALGAWELPEPVTAPVPLLPNATEKERALWATAARKHDRFKAACTAQRLQKDRSGPAVKALMQERDSLPTLRDICFAGCQQWFDERAALYNRARTGWFGLAKTKEHKIPQFRHVELSGGELRMTAIAQLDDLYSEVRA